MTDDADDERGGDRDPEGGVAELDASGDDAVDGGGETDDEAGERAHLQDIEDGAGCAEIWERIAEHREDREDRDDAERTRGVSDG